MVADASLCDCPPPATAPLKNRFNSARPIEEKVLLLCGFVILGGVLAHGLWRAFRARGVFFRWVASRGKVQGDCESRDFHDCIAQGVRARMEANVSSVVEFMRFAGLISVATVCVNLAREVDRFLTIEQCGLVFAGTAVAWIAYVLAPQALRARPGVVYSSVMAYICAFLLLASEEGPLMFVSETFMCIFRLVVGAKFYGMRSVGVWAVLCGISSTIAFLRTMDDFMALGSLVAYEVFMVCTCIGVSYLAAREAERQVRVLVQAVALRSDNLGSWNLLELVCDVAVPLDEDLRISDRALRFGALVMMRGKSMEGALLQDFMPMVEDREALERCISAAQPGDTGVVHVSFRDSMGNMVRVELFCVTFERLGRRRFLVGIRELSDVAPAFQVQPDRVRRPLLAAANPRAGGGAAAAAVDTDLISLPSFDTGVSVTSAPTSCVTDDLVEAVAPAVAETAPTSSAGVEMALLQLMRLISLPPIQGRGACCAYHAAAALLLLRLKRLRGQPCLPSWQPHFDAQCAHCGFLADLPEGPGSSTTCFACEEDVGRSPAPQLLSM